MSKFVDFLKGGVLLSLVLVGLFLIATILSIFIMWGLPEHVTAENVSSGIRFCIVMGFLGAAMAVGME